MNDENHIGLDLLPFRNSDHGGAAQVSCKAKGLCLLLILTTRMARPATPDYFGTRHTRTVVPRPDRSAGFAPGRAIHRSARMKPTAPTRIPANTSAM